MKTRHRGAIAIEFMLILPLTAAALAVLFGVAEAMQLKRQAMIQSQFAGLSAQIIAEPNVTHAMAFETTEKWVVSVSPKGEDFGQLLQLGEGSEVDRLLRDVIARALPSQEVEFSASLTTERRFVLRLIGGSPIHGTYVLPIGFWDSDECGAFLPLLQDIVQIGGNALSL